MLIASSPWNGPLSNSPSSAMKFDMEGVEMYDFSKLSSMSQLRTYSISTIGYASKK
jgi:hypothetical protein